MQTISLGQAIQLINHGKRAVLVAAQSAADFATDHIPGSHRVDLTDLTACDRLDRTLRGTRHPRVILYATADGPEAYQIARDLEQRCGVESVSVLEGGLQAWADAGYSTWRDLGRDRLSKPREEVDRELVAAGRDDVAPMA